MRCIFTGIPTVGSVIVLNVKFCTVVYPSNHTCRCSFLIVATMDEVMEWCTSRIISDVRICPSAQQLGNDNHWFRHVPTILHIP